MHRRPKNKNATKYLPYGQVVEVDKMSVQPYAHHVPNLLEQKPYNIKYAEGSTPKNNSRGVIVALAPIKHNGVVVNFYGVVVAGFYYAVHQNGVRPIKSCW